MGQAESKDNKRSPLGSGQFPQKFVSAHHLQRDENRRASSPAQALSIKQRPRRSSLGGNDDTNTISKKPQTDGLAMEPLKSLAGNVTKLPNVLPNVIVPVIEQLRGRRGRRLSGQEGPINMKSPIKSNIIEEDPDLPHISKNDIYAPDSEDEEPAETQTRFRSRASTIGNGQIPRLARKPSSEESEVNKCDRSNIKVTVVLRYTKAKIGTKRVFLAGSMTQWKTIEMGHCTGESTFDLVLECLPGKYYYKFYVNNEWVVDESLPMTSYFRRSSGSFGPKTVMANVIIVKAEDNEVFEALACDSFSIKSDSKFPEKGWGQNKPNFESQIASTGSSHASAGPPILPPHLLSIILNKDIPETHKSDKTLLPEPSSHVMLNHLYAQSIRDQMLVMATTARYKKKCVTIVYYKPI